MTVDVKICGLSTPATMAVALEAGADYVGLVFFPPSPRTLDMATAVPLADMARGKRDIEACAKSKRTVDWYRDKCLPTKTCEQFMDCTMDLAMQEP